VFVFEPKTQRYNALMPDKRKMVYLDYGATTPLDERVWEAMLPYFREQFGNPVSVHHFGQQAEFALETARKSIADSIKARPDQIVFTSGATESDNLALRGVAFSERRKRGAKHILISAVDHEAVLATGRQLEELHDFELEIIPVNEFGAVEPAELEKRIRKDTAIVSIIMASNEVGTINSIAELAKVCRAKQIPFHTDAVQAGAYLKLDVEALDVDLLSMGAHKFYGPKGIGFLYVREHDLLAGIQTGGGHEFNLRAGTQNTPYIVGMAKAYELLQSELEERNQYLLKLRDRLIGGVLENIEEAQLTGHPSMRLPNHSSFVFKDVDGNALLMQLDQAGFACSSGSACKTGDPAPSEVLLALGLEHEWALGSLRVTIGMHTKEEEIDAFLDQLPAAVEASKLTVAA